MKVLQVSKFLVHRGGVETYLFDLGALLEDAGHDVQYFGLDDPGKVVGNRWNIYAPNMELGGKQGLSRVKDVARTIESAENAKRFSELLNAFQPDVVHFNNIHYHLTPSVLEAAVRYRRNAKKHISLVMTMHDYHSIVPCDGCMNNRSYEICDECLDGHFLRCAVRGCTRGGRAKSFIAAAEAYWWKRRRIYAGLDVAICPSNYMKKKFDRVPEFAGRTVHLPNFTNLERRTYEKNRYVLYFGAYNRDKGVATLLDIARRHPEIRFKFAGKGPLASSMQEMPNVEDLGFNTGEVLRSIVGRATLAVMPSECLENSPFAVLEALCSGTPVLGANIGGIPELIDDGVTGELFEFRDEEDLEEKLISLWNDPDRCARYSRNCAEFEPMSSGKYLARLMGIYGCGMDEPYGEIR